MSLYYNIKVFQLFGFLEFIVGDRNNRAKSKTDKFCTALAELPGTRPIRN